MTQFSYIATDANNNVIKGKTSLPSRSAVIEALSKQQLRPISVKQIKERRASIDFNHLFESNRVKQDQLVSFTRQLSAMIGAGVPLLRSLTSIEKHAESLALKRVLSAVVKDVEGGLTLGDALSKHPKVFNDIYVNMVRAGESAGILDDILKRLALQQENSASIKRRIRGATAYPLVLLVITVIAFFGLMLFVVPQIGTILTDIGGPDAELPGITQFMLGLSHIFTSYWYIIFPGLIAIGVGITMYIRRTAIGRRQFDTIVLKLPGIKKIITKIAVARFARTFSALMGAGVAVLEALDVTSRSLGNVLYEDSLKRAAIEVRNGKSLSSVLENDELFPSIVAQMLAVGEETGQTDTVLVKVAEFYDEEVKLAIESISSIIEPVLIVFMGTMVGLIAASVMTPIASYHKIFAKRGDKTNWSCYNNLHSYTVGLW